MALFRSLIFENLILCVYKVCELGFKTLKEKEIHKNI